jgi:ribonuclease HI
MKETFDTAKDNEMKGQLCRIIRKTEAFIPKMPPIDIYVHGQAGKRGEVSTCVWFRPSTSLGAEKHQGWTEVEAEYHAIVAALRALPPGSIADIYSSNPTVVDQLNDEFVLQTPSQHKLYWKVRGLRRTRRLVVEFMWISRSKNKADADICWQLLLP